VIPVRSRALAVALLLLLAAPLSADTVMLKSGKSLNGTIKAEHPDRIELELESGEVKTILRSEIVLVRKGRSIHEEYKSRLAEAKGDAEKLRELAAWCESKKMKRQRRSVLREILKLEPDCGEARHAAGQIWNGEKWVKDRAKGRVPAPKPGRVVAFQPQGVKAVLPEGWTSEIGPERSVIRGPARYRRPVEIEILTVDGPPEARFKDEGWLGEPTAATLGGLTALMAERDVKEDGCSLRIRELAAASAGRTVVVRYVALAFERQDWEPHLALVLKKLEVVAAAKPDYVNRRLGIGFRYPKNQGWEVHEEAMDDAGLALLHRGMDATDQAVLAYACMGDAPAAGLSDEAIRQELIRQFRALGQVTAMRNERKSYLGTLPGTVWDADMLMDGVPRSARFLAAVKDRRIHVLVVITHFAVC
jgi:hypothetical protein